MPASMWTAIGGVLMMNKSSLLLLGWVIIVLKIHRREEANCTMLDDNVFSWSDLFCVLTGCL